MSTLGFGVLTGTTERIVVQSISDNPMEMTVRPGVSNMLPTPRRGCLEGELVAFTEAGEGRRPRRRGRGQPAR